MQKNLSTGHVPADRIIEVINDATGAEWPWYFPTGPYDDHSPLMPLTRFWQAEDIKKMVDPSGRNGGWIDFDLADKMLCALGLQGRWREGLLDLYLEVNLERVRHRMRTAEIGRKRCENDRCSNTFDASTPRSGRPQKYCSTRCRVAAGNRRMRDKIRVHRYGTEHGSCANGHDRSPENTYISPQGKRLCRECAKENARRTRARKKLAVAA